MCGGSVIFGCTNLDACNFDGEACGDDEANSRLVRDARIRRRATTMPPALDDGSCLTLDECGVRRSGHC